MHATLVEASLRVHTRLVEPLRATKPERHYREMALMERLFGVPAKELPYSIRFRTLRAAGAPGQHRRP